MKDPLLAGTKLDRYFHICAFFNSREEEYDVLYPFYKEGADWGEKGLHIVNPKLKDDHVKRLKAKGLDADHCIACGQLEVVGADVAYLRDGVFDQHRMLETVEAVFAAGKQAGFPRLRIMGNMGWAFDYDIDTDRLIDYEARVNYVLSRNRQPAICVYDTAWLTGTMMMDILRCHPLTLVGGVVQENPFFVPPDDLLPKLKARKEAQASRLRH